MIELLVLFFLWGKIQDLLYGKGYEETLRYQLLLPLFWFGGEFVAGVAFTVSADGQPGRPDLATVYGVALLGAVASTAILFVILKRLPNRETSGEPVFRHRRRR